MCGLYYLTRMQLNRNTSGPSPFKNGFSAPESRIMAMIFRAFAPISLRLFSRSGTNMPTKAPHDFPALSPHTSR